MEVVGNLKHKNVVELEGYLPPKIKTENIELKGTPKPRKGCHLISE